jgi:hypothetical protein
MEDCGESVLTDEITCQRRGTEGSAQMEQRTRRKL